METFRKTKKMYISGLCSMPGRKNVLAGYLIGMIIMLKTAFMYSRFAGNHTVCLAESGILHYADKGNALLMILGCIITMFDAPYIDERSFFLLHRVGRKSWYRAMWAYIITGCSMYFLSLCLVGMLPFAWKGYIENAWSQTMEVSVKSGIAFMSEAGLVPPAECLMELTPFVALLHTLLGMILYSICLTAVLFIFNMRTNKYMAGTIAAGGVYVVSLLLSSSLIGGRNLSKWSLYDNALFAAFYNPQSRPLLFTYCYFILVLCLLYYAGERILPHVSFVLGVEKG